MPKAKTHTTNDLNNKNVSVTIPSKSNIFYQNEKMKEMEKLAKIIVRDASTKQFHLLNQDKNISENISCSDDFIAGSFPAKHFS